eukprot:GHVH01001945.1.p1 GENE.GHVH01001945.1~~GHVH01001945.1.p1  ORF type:complete len:212 (+),score=29.73 GHVH01001945.1:109-744(+)
MRALRNLFIVAALSFLSEAQFLKKQSVQDVAQSHLRGDKVKSSLPMAVPRRQLMGAKPRPVSARPMVGPEAGRERQIQQEHEINVAERSSNTARETQKSYTHREPKVKYQRRPDAIDDREQFLKREIRINTKRRIGLLDDELGDIDFIAEWKKYQDEIAPYNLRVDRLFKGETEEETLRRAERNREEDNSVARVINTKRRNQEFMKRNRRG